MSHNFHLVNTECSDTENENVSELECCEHRKTSETVGSLTKWVSSLEDKITHCTSQIERLQDQLNDQSESLRAIQELLKVLTNRVDCRKRLREATHCNRELGVALSAKLYRSEAKRTKTLAPHPETIHPFVQPFLVDKESDVE